MRRHPSYVRENFPQRVRSARATPAELEAIGLGEDHPPAWNNQNAIVGPSSDQRPGWRRRREVPPGMGIMSCIFPQGMRKK